MSDLKRLRELAATLKFLSFIEKRLEYADEMASLIPGALDHIDSQAREIEDHKEARQLLASDLVALAEGKKVKTLLAAAVEHMLTAQAQVIEKLVEAITTGHGDCPGCGTIIDPEMTSHHAPECPLAAALALAEKPQTQETQ